MIRRSSYAYKKKVHHVGRTTRKFTRDNRPRNSHGRFDPSPKQIHGFKVGLTDEESKLDSQESKGVWGDSGTELAQNLAKRLSHCMPKVST